MTAPVYELPRPIQVDQLKDREKHFPIEATADERAALARRFGILAIDALKADVALKLMAGGLVKLTGRVQAQVHQACVVTLVDVPETIDSEFERVYSPDAEPVEEEDFDAVDFDFTAEDPPDPLIDGIIDIGEAVAEEVALALDPYPRAPGAVFDRPPEGEPERQNPFAALAKLKKDE